MEWTPEEEVMLAKAYIHCKYDRQHGNQQKKDSLWREVRDHFIGQGGSSRRTTHQLSTKWSSMLTKLNWFNGFYTQAVR